MFEPKRTPPGPGQESVWDYPRPPRLEEVNARIRVVFNGTTIADTHRSKRVLETSHPPNYYIPPEDVNMQFLQKTPGSSVCEWKGTATYYTVVVGRQRAERAAWSYPNPTIAFAVIRDYVAFYAGAVDECYVDGERVTPQPGGFYGGWITKNILGPFKGEPGTMA
jgi:uncharacterized protein (DUF427 family)